MTTVNNNQTINNAFAEQAEHHSIMQEKAGQASKNLDLNALLRKYSSIDTPMIIHSITNFVTNQLAATKNMIVPMVVPRILNTLAASTKYIPYLPQSSSAEVAEYIKNKFPFLSGILILPTPNRIEKALDEKIAKPHIPSITTIALRKNIVNPFITRFETIIWNKNSANPLIPPGKTIESEQALATPGLLTEINAAIMKALRLPEGIENKQAVSCFAPILSSTTPRIPPEINAAIIKASYQANLIENIQNKQSVPGSTPTLSSTTPSLPPEINAAIINTPHQANAIDNMRADESFVVLNDSDIIPLEEQNKRSWSKRSINSVARFFANIYHSITNLFAKLIGMQD